MTFTRRSATFALLASFALTPLTAQTSATPARANGPFDVKVTQQEDRTDPAITRYTFDKQFHGDLEATSKGEMLATGSSSGTGSYVAMEIVTGKLGNHTGSFALQHTGTMINNAFTLTVTVVPGSGTGELAGLSGKMNIIIAPGGKHSYDFEYALPSAK